MRHTLIALVLAGLTLLPSISFGQNLNFGAMTDAERAAFREEVRAYLLQNPEVIFEAIQILEQKRNLAAEQADRDLLLSLTDKIYNDGFSFIGGNPEGDITVVEFLDYRCGYCKRAHPEIQEVLDRDPNVRLIVKEFPILGPDSISAGKMALAALDLDSSRYEELGDRLMTYPGNLTEQAAYKIAGEAGYDLVELKTRANSEVIEERMQTNYQLAQALGLQGTPAFIVGSEIIRGYLPVEDMLGAIQSARSERR